jgi:hypothetical protein
VLVIVLTPNYAFKPSAEQALRMNRSISCRAGLTRRWASEAVADRGRALRWKGRNCLERICLELI